MIKITRLSEPSILKQQKALWTQELCDARRNYYQELQAYRQGHRPNKPGKPDAIQSRYAHQEIKAQLKLMFGTKCAYCESPVESVSYQEIY